MKKFESQEYRNNLAHKLKEIRNSDEKDSASSKEEAKEFLEKKQQTKKYEDVKQEHDKERNDIMFLKERSISPEINKQFEKISNMEDIKDYDVIGFLPSGGDLVFAYKNIVWVLNSLNSKIDIACPCCSLQRICRETEITKENPSGYELGAENSLARTLRKKGYLLSGDIDHQNIDDTEKPKLKYLLISAMVKNSWTDKDIPGIVNSGNKPAGLTEIVEHFGREKE